MAFSLPLHLIRRPPWQPPSPSTPFLSISLHQPATPNDSSEISPENLKSPSLPSLRRHSLSRRPYPLVFPFFGGTIAPKRPRLLLLSSLLNASGKPPTASGHFPLLSRRLTTMQQHPVTPGDDSQKKG